MSYAKIVNEIGEKVPHTTIRGLRLAIKNRKLSDGRYTGIFPGGTKQIFELTSTSVGKEKKSVTRVKARHTQTNKVQPHLN